MRPSLRSDLAKRTKFAILLNKNTIDAISCQEAEKKINKTKLKTPINRHYTTTECFLKKIYLNLGSDPEKGGEKTEKNFLDKLHKSGLQLKVFMSIS